MEPHRPFRILLGIVNILYLTSLRIWSYLFSMKCYKIQPTEDPMFKLSATKLAKMIRQREITSFQVTHAYIQRVIKVNRLINAVVDTRYQLALTEATICDEQLAAGTFDAETLEKEKPLYGVPITIKECCALQGASYTGCTLARKGIKATKDSTIVELMKNAGAIPIGVTNTPEMSCNFDTSNKVYGTTLNPYDFRYSAGGSSGGEGALLGAGASLIGIGSDLAGSIRIPALFNGVFGYKPTAGIISDEGHFPQSEDKSFKMYLTLGPMARYAEDLGLLMKILTAKCGHDLRLSVPVDLKQLKVYYVPGIDKEFNILPTSPDISQCVLKAANYFSELGIRTEKLPFEWPSTIAELTTISLLNIQEPPQLLLSRDSKVQKSPRMEFIKSLFGLSQHMRITILYANMLKTRFPFSRSAIAYYVEQREQLRKKFVDLLGEDGIFICPTFRCPTTFPTLIIAELPSCAYSGIFNIFGCPAVHVPMGLNEEDLPIGVQVVAAPHQDRLCLAVAKELETAFGGWTPPPFPY